ncbi:SAM-dependent methyltransferase, partial [Amycolatopsis sp.]|uniref:SAM-dependent methyltransferase n=1 Tax=Amycolatopsis sp. TaxID=37632 RepID=UPI0039C8724A
MAAGRSRRSRRAPGAGQPARARRAQELAILSGTPDLPERRMSEDDYARRGIDLDKPNPARVYDYILGGELNYAVDRM